MSEYCKGGVMKVYLLERYYRSDYEGEHVEAQEIFFNRNDARKKLADYATEDSEEQKGTIEYYNRILKDPGSSSYSREDAVKSLKEIKEETFQDKDSYSFRDIGGDNCGRIIKQDAVIKGNSWYDTCIKAQAERIKELEKKIIDLGGNPSSA